MCLSSLKLYIDQFFGDNSSKWLPRRLKFSKFFRGSPWISPFLSAQKISQTLLWSRGVPQIDPNDGESHGTPRPLLMRCPFGLPHKKFLVLLAHWKIERLIKLLTSALNCLIFESSSTIAYFINFCFLILSFRLWGTKIHFTSQLTRAINSGSLSLTVEPRSIREGKG